MLLKIFCKGVIDFPPFSFFLKKNLAKAKDCMC